MINDDDSSYQIHSLDLLILKKEKMESLLNTPLNSNDFFSFDYDGWKRFHAKEQQFNVLQN